LFYEGYSDAEPRLARPSVNVDTSEQAAESMKPTAGLIRGWVECWLRDRGAHGATEQEVEDALSLPGNTIRPRLWELENTGKIVKSPDKRQNRSGRYARVYRAV
jgi:hypothetical protein